MYPRFADAVQPEPRDGSLPVVGRDRELAAVFHALTVGLDGAGSAICIEGVPGMGKSTILQAAVGRASALGYGVLTAKASAAESEFPFGVVRQLFEDAPAEPAHADGDDGLVAGVLDGRHEPGDEAAVLHALHRLTARLAAREPLLIAVDDVDQADPPSLRWLAYLHRRMHRMPVVLVITVGLGGTATDRALLIEVVGAAQRLTLCPLDADGCADLVRAVLAPQQVAVEFAQACCAASDGNPFLLGELLHVLRAERIRPDGRAVEQVRRCRPPWLAGRLLARLRAHDPVLATLARAVAVLGTPDLEVAAAAAGIALPAAAAAAQTLARTGILRTGRRLQFRSSIAQSAIVRDISPEQRDGIHARAATLLWSARAAPERIAAHLLETASVEGGWVAETLCEVGRQAIADGGADLALACLRRALREPLAEDARDEVLLTLGMVEVLGHPADAIEHLGAVHGDRAEAQRLLMVTRGYAASIGGESARRAVELATRAWQERSPARRSTGDPDLRTVAELCPVVLTLTYADRLGAARQCCQDVLDGANGPVVTEVANALTAMIDYRAGEVPAAMAAARAALDAGGWMAAAIALPVLINAAVDRDELAVARQAVEHANLSVELPEFWRYHYLLGGRGRLHAAAGDLQAALTDQLECGRRFQDSGILNPAVVPWRSHAAVLYARLGLHDRAVELAAQELTLARRWGAPRALGIALRAAGAVSQGERGRALLGEAVAVLRESGATLELARALAELGGLLGRAGRRDESVETLRRARELAHRCGAVGLLAAIDGQLRAAQSGERPSGRRELTPHELRIATMVVSGRTNRDIAAELRVTSRAVELHLTKLYRKLGIARRSQLATALNCHGYRDQIKPAS